MYVFFELNLIKELGFDPDLSKFKDDKLNNFDIKKIKIDTFFYNVPGFLILKKIPKNIPKNLLKNSLYFTRSIIQNRFFFAIQFTFSKG